MRIQQSGIPLLLVASCILVLSLFPRCAQIVAPTGGPKDTIPPYLVSAMPPDSSLNFHSKRIELSFDEFIQIQNLQKQLIIAPSMQRQPTFKAKLRSLSIQFTDSLKPNTTYTLNMGNAIEDIDEGNPLRNFRYVFSTGPYLDSLELGGKLWDASTGMPDSNIAVFLYTDLKDSVVSKEKPLYYTRTQGDGTFLFENLPHGIFKVFALKDANGDLQYDDTSEAIAFLNKPVRLDSNQLHLPLYLFKEAVPDTGNHPVKVVSGTRPAKKGKSAPAKPRFLQIALQLHNGKQDLNKDLVLHFDSKLSRLDTSGIAVYEDTSRVRIHPKLQLDSLHQNLHFRYPWKEDLPYQVIADSGFATDTSGLTLEKSDTLAFLTRSLSDYGILTLHFDGVDSSKNYVVFLYQNGTLAGSGPLVHGTWKQEFLDPGMYSVKILEDINGNGKWDTGIYYGRPQRQPERVFDVKGQFNIRANWINDFTHLKWTPLTP